MQFPILLALNALMAFVYTASGIYILMYPRIITSLPSSTNMFIGILLVCYGLFRGYRAYQSFQKNA